MRPSKEIMAAFDYFMETLQETFPSGTVVELTVVPPSADGTPAPFSEPGNRPGEFMFRSCLPDLPDDLDV